ncbi:hypothetical protein EKO04_001955 [Ascochyta lentis]|uniref:Uncharacterized protein n=1 Tax=Ascochyta lentis TaxID=205686 RepID=A0A8H7MKR0_9PLEO|nr:hypothetical protein EKO04_001955 [Ascochyta lentis]
MPAPKTLATPMVPTFQMPPAMASPTGLMGPPSVPGPPLETLEQRIYDLLAPFREIDFDAEGEVGLPSRKSECKALILCENVAFLIRHNQASYGKHIEPNDISFAAKGWVARTMVNGFVGIGIFVNGNGFSHTVLRTTIAKGEDVVDKLADKADELLQPFFPGV